MKQFFCSRRQGQTKKQLYRRIAQTKKMQWANTHKSQNQTLFRSHFVTAQEQNLADDFKNKKIQKEVRSQQRLRNRMAAQQSRERHRCYVEELKRKARLYDQLISRQQSVLCQKCKNAIQTQQDSQALLSSQYPQSASLKSPQEQILLDEGLEEQMIRIDNTGATSPYGIFFIICIVAVLAVLSFRNEVGHISQRVLVNYRLLNDQLIDQNSIPEPKKDSLPAFLQLVKSKSKKQSISCVNQKVQTNSYIPSQNLRSLSTPFSHKNWQKFGNYVCSQPQTEFNFINKQFDQSPDFLLVRSNKDKKSILQLDSALAPKVQIEKQDSLTKQQQDILISQCFLQSA